MNLLHQEHIEKIDNCPIDNQLGVIKLYRWVKREDFKNSFNPHGFKEHLRNNCLAWGLSTYNSEKGAKEVLNNLPVKRRKDFNAIAFCIINDENGIKHQSSGNKNHFTFYPNKDFDVLSNFQIIEDEN